MFKAILESHDSNRTIQSRPILDSESPIQCHEETDKLITNMQYEKQIWQQQHQSKIQKQNKANKTRHIQNTFTTTKQKN